MRTLGMHEGQFDDEQFVYIWGYCGVKVNVENAFVVSLAEGKQLGVRLRPTRCLRRCQSLCLLRFRRF